MLEVCGLSKSFGGIHAVQDIDFTVPAGQIVSFISLLVGGCYGMAKRSRPASRIAWHSRASYALFKRLMCCGL